MHQEDLGLTNSLPKREYTNVSCYPHPKLQVYGESINHVTDTLAQNSDISLDCVMEAGAPVGKFQMSISTKINLFYTTCVKSYFMAVNHLFFLSFNVFIINIFITLQYSILNQYKSLESDNHGCKSWVISNDMVWTGQ